VSEVERGLGEMKLIHSAQFEISIEGVPRAKLAFTATSEMPPHGRPQLVGSERR
jgi:hypothetical protein